MSAGIELPHLLLDRFRDPERARANLRRIAERAPAAVAAPLPTLLAESPDPDAALNGFERLAAAPSEELFAQFEQHPFLIHYAVTIFGYSHFLSDTVLQNQDLFHTFAREKKLDKLYTVDDFREALARFRSRSLEPDLATTLARFKRREYVRIMLRDVLGVATLGEVTAEISMLADVLIAEALREAQLGLRARHGAPRAQDAAGRWIEPAIAVIALGKLGGNELNYSSDVDLFFLYRDGEPAEPRAGEETGRQQSNREFFIRLAQQVSETLSRATPHGPVFRIDLRLRPEGGEGEPAVALRHALHYYAHVAHDWELQAMIKARHAAGDAALTRELLHAVEPFVYKQQINFVAIETALNSLQRMSRRRRGAALAHPRAAPFRRRSGGRAAVAASGNLEGARPPGEPTEPSDVKLDRGGIRDIEFLVQCLQRVYGGSDPWLRSGSTLLALQRLHDKGQLSGQEFHELGLAYEFLRRVEHRLQLRRGQQTHQLPQSREEQEWLGRALAGEPRQRHAMPVVAPREVERMVRQRMAAVSVIYNRIVHHQQLQQERAGAAAEFRLESSVANLEREPAYRQVLARLAQDAPELYRLASRPGLAGVARRNLQRFLSAAFTSSERYATVLRHPAELESALLLFERSEYLTGVLVRHPEAIATLASTQDASAKLSVTGTREPLLLADADSGEQEDPMVAYLSRAELNEGEKLAILRQHYRAREFASGAADVLHHRPVYSSLAETTAAAASAIRAASVIAGAERELAVMALGRLGTFEFDVGSDADLLFVRSEAADHGAATRTAEKTVQALAAYTREGTVFPVDSRLRPHGKQGELVVSPAQLAAYFADEAQPWEALSYTKLRHVAGPATLAAQARQAVRSALPRFAQDPGFAAAARQMRQRQEASVAGQQDFKLNPGGFYDIDFIASFLWLKLEAPGERAAMRALLGELRRRGALSEADARELDSAAELLRATEHLIRLVTGRTHKWLPLAEHARGAVEQLTAATLRREFSAGLEAELVASAGRVRAIFDRVFGL